MWASLGDNNSFYDGETEDCLQAAKVVSSFRLHIATVRYEIDSDITIAETLPGAFYHDAAVFDSCRERVFAKSWQWLGETNAVAQTAAVSPRTILPGLLNEPVFLAKDAIGTLRCFPNVCTHRGNVLVAQDGAAKDIRCGYHSRRFDFQGA